MRVPSSTLGYLRLVLHQETDGILMARKRPAALPLPIPEVREVKALLQVLVGLGVEKVRLAGDDPALREDLGAIVEMVAGIDGVREVAMTTRGLDLAGRLNTLAKRGLKAVNFDVETLSAARYEALAGAGQLKDVQAAIDTSISLGLKVKLNVVLERGVNDDEIVQWVALTRDQPVQVRFIEWNCRTDRIAPPGRFISTRETMAAIKAPLIPRESSFLDGPALVYGIPEHRGTIGFIPNVTEHFCSTCGRIGLTDSGEILSCIFGRGLNLIKHLRSPGGVTSVAAFVDRVIRRKLLLASKMGDFPSASVQTQMTHAIQLPG